MPVQPPLEVTVRRGAAGIVVTFDGELDIAGDAAARRALTPLADQPRKVVLDLTGLSFCDLPGMRTIVEFTRTAAARGVDVELRGAGGQVGRLLRLTHARGVLPLGE
jgi:anti-sigma B factor antagonist